MNPILLNPLVATTGSPDASSSPQAELTDLRNNASGGEATRDFASVLYEEGIAPAPDLQPPEDEIDLKTGAVDPETELPSDEVAVAKADKARGDSPPAQAGDGEDLLNAPRPKVDAPQHTSMPVRSVPGQPAGPQVGTAVETDAPISLLPPGGKQNAAQVPLKAADAPGVKQPPDAKTRESQGVQNVAGVDSRQTQPNGTMSAVQEAGAQAALSPRTKTEAGQGPLPQTAQGEADQGNPLVQRSKDTAPLEAKTKAPQPASGTQGPQTAADPLKLAASPVDAKQPIEQRHPVAALLNQQSKESNRPATDKPVALSVPTAEPRRVASRERDSGPPTSSQITPTLAKPTTSSTNTPTLALTNPAETARIKSELTLSSGVSGITDPEGLFPTRADFTVSNAQQQTNIPTRMDLPGHVSRQVAEALQNMPSRPVEISLNPEELGRVRLGVSSTDAGITVSVLAERPETIDLMRRHISALEAAFQAIGYSDINFSFNGGNTADADTNTNSQQGSNNHAEQAHLLIETPDTPQNHTYANAGLDLRL